MKEALALFGLLFGVQFASAVELPQDQPRLVDAAHAIPAQAWQDRRARFARLVRAVQAGDPKASKDFDAVLTEFDTHPLARTPIENMEILGTYYVAREGVEKSLPVVAMNAMLGWYDALRFGSASGRAEISQSLFKTAFIVAGSKRSNEAAQLFEEQPEKTWQLVSQGIALASRNRNKTSYDTSWPAAFGLEHILCAQGGACEPVRPLPESEWDTAWEQARQRVIAYYRGSKPFVPRPQ